MAFIEIYGYFTLFNAYQTRVKYVYKGCYPFSFGGITAKKKTLMIKCLYSELLRTRF